MFLSNLFSFADLHVCLIILLNLMVIFFKNPIHSLLCFIFGVINVIAIFIFFEADFIALIFFLVYVGAIAVLFLALIMFLNLSYLFYTESTSISKAIFSTNRLFTLLFIALIMFSVNEIFTIQVHIPTISYINLHTFGIHYLSYLMYEKYSFLIIFSGFLLFFTTLITLAYTTLPRYFSSDVIKALKHREKIFSEFVKLEHDSIEKEFDKNYRILYRFSRDKNN